MYKLLVYTSSPPFVEAKRWTLRRDFYYAWTLEIECKRRACIIVSEALILSTSMLPLGVCSKLVLATKESSDEVILQNKVSRQVQIYIMMMIGICMILIGEQYMDVIGICTKNMTHAIIVLKTTT